MSAPDLNRRRFLGASAAAVTAAALAPGDALAAPPEPGAESGLLIRGPDGALYLIGDDKLAAFRLPDNETTKLRPVLAGVAGARHMSASVLRRASAVCATYGRGLTFVDLGAVRRGD